MSKQDTIKQYKTKYIKHPETGDPVTAEILDYKYNELSRVDGLVLRLPGGTVVEMTYGEIRSRIVEEG